MKSYTRKEINQQVDRFRKTRFVPYEGYEQAIAAVLEMAVEAGADLEKMDLIIKSK